MAEMTGKTVLMVGVLGAGGYLVYEYMQYSNALNSLAAAGAGTASNLEQALPFLTYLSMNWGGTGSAAQVQIYQAIQAVLAGNTTTGATTPGTPAPTVTGTTTPTPTTISTAPATTPAPPAPTLTPQPVITRLPVTARAGIVGMAAQMQSAIQMTMANADQWNYAFQQITGKAISAYYGFTFDAVYGPVVNGARSSGSLTAQAFLSMAQAAATITPATAPAGGSVVPLRTKNTSGVRGLGRIALYGRPYVTTGSMAYGANHPFPYQPSYTLKGLGAVTQPMGFERALYAGQSLRSNKVF